jgi:hypothetical protein
VAEPTEGGRHANGISAASGCFAGGVVRSEGHFVKRSPGVIRCAASLMDS